jgi:ATP-binding cassette subfamily C (CFTR/MRP) protein 5
VCSSVRRGEESCVTSPPGVSKPVTSEAGKVLITSEVQVRGEVKTLAYYSYIQAAGGFFVSFIVVTLILLNVGTSTFSSWWLAVWIKAGSGNTSVIDPLTNETVISDRINDNPDLNFYMQVYAGSIGLMLLTSLIRGVIFTQVVMLASKRLHNTLLVKIMSSPMKYFETTPIGRIQNIFSRDFDEG